MKSHLYYLVSPKDNKRNHNEKEVEGGKLIVNSDLQDHIHVNREAVIESVPMLNDLGLSVGDEVIVHHNIFRRFYDMQGNEKNSRWYVDGDIYKCTNETIFMVKREGSWTPLDGFCFVKPIDNTNMWSEDKEEPLKGLITYVPKELKDLGISENALIGFTPMSEYEFNIDGDKLYRVPSNSVSILYED